MWFFSRGSLQLPAESSLTHSKDNNLDIVSSVKGGKESKSLEGVVKSDHNQFKLLKRSKKSISSYLSSTDGATVVLLALFFGALHCALLPSYLECYGGWIK